jgi:hypothetical protein
LKLTFWFWRRFFFLISNVFYSIDIIFLSLYKLESPLDDLRQLGKNWPSGSEEVENVKIYTHSDGRRTKGNKKSLLQVS